MVFKVGQKVVYPSQGVGIIEQIEARQINGEAQEFYLLRLHNNNSLVMVPTRNAEGAPQTVSDSIHGSAIVTPTPLRNVRRENWCVVIGFYELVNSYHVRRPSGSETYMANSASAVQ